MIRLGGATSLDVVIEGKSRLGGVISVPGDKSISHRAAILAAIARGTSRITGFSPSSDCSSTLGAITVLGVSQDREGSWISIEGRGEEGFIQPQREIDAGNSATTMRLLSGVIASMPITATLTGDASLKRRPMRRIAEPLELMGARFEAADSEGHPPLSVRGSSLKGIDYSPPVASAQVKSAVLLAGLRASGRTTVNEMARTRDHTERMLEYMGVGVRRNGLAASVEAAVPSAREITIPGDISSAAFLVAASILCPDSEVRIEGVGLNPTRTGFLDIVCRMGARVTVDKDENWEPVGRVVASHSDLSAVDLDAGDVARAIDEIPLVALMASRAAGRTVIHGAGELRLKESDRIRNTVTGLRAMGAEVEETRDGMVIEGPCRLRGTRVSPGKDHRLALMFAVAGMVAEGKTVVEDWEWTEVSFPGFIDSVVSLGGRA